MTREDFDQYMVYFNSRKYDEVLSYFADDFSLKFAGYDIRGRDQFLDFYGFFHSMVNEQIEVLQFAGDAENVVIDVNVRAEGRDNLTQELLNEKGYERLLTLEKGEIKVLPQFIHYMKNDRGKFKTVICVIKDTV